MLRYFSQIGVSVFGGPFALIQRMQEDLVIKRKWFSDGTYQQALALSQLAPGPIAAKVAMFFGWQHSGVLGAGLVGFFFLLPSFLIVIVLAHLYVLYGSLVLVQELAFGVRGGALALLILSALKLARQSYQTKDRAIRVILVANAILVALLTCEPILPMLLSGVLFAFWKHPGQRVSRVLREGSFLLLPFLITGLHGPATGSLILQMASYFFKVGALVFGSGLVIVPFLKTAVVGQYHWLTEAQFLDALAVAMITPGPIVIAVCFIGYCMAGFFGSVVAGTAIFLPSFLIIVVVCPLSQAIGKRPFISRLILGMATAATGAILGVAIQIARSTFTDWRLVAVCLGTLGAMIKWRIVPEPVWILVSAILGLVLVGI